MCVDVHFSDEREESRCHRVDRSSVAAFFAGGLRLNAGDQEQDDDDGCEGAVCRGKLQHGSGLGLALFERTNELTEASSLTLYMKRVCGVVDAISFAGEGLKPS